MKSRPPAHRSAVGAHWILAIFALAVLSPGASAQADAGVSGVLDTSALSFYGFYGFYGAATPTLSCGHVRFKYTLYNYGAADLTTVSTIREILDRSKRAISAGVAEAAPELGPQDYSITLSELNGAAVTHVVVTADVDFGNSAQAGGRFLAYLGVSPEDLLPDGGLSELGPPAADYPAELALQAAVSGQAVAQGATVEVFGLAEAGPEAVAVAANLLVAPHAAAGADTYYTALTTDPYAVYPLFGGLAGQVKVTEIIRGAGDAKLKDDDSAGRKLLQDSRRDSNLARHLAEAGLGAASVQDAECPSVSSFYGFYGVSDQLGSSGAAEGSSASFVADSSGAVVGSSGAVVGSSGAAGSSGAVLNSDGSADFYGTTSFYGTSFYGTSFYGTSFYGVNSTTGGPSPSGPVSPPGVQTYPVYFTAILSDYNMEDLTNPEDLEALKALYISSVDSSLELIGITSDPVVSVLSVKAGSVAVDTLVLFVNDPEGADLLEEDPEVSGPDGMPGRVDPGNQAEAGDSPSRICSDIDRFGECCYSPAALDAKRDCCWDGVDECGVCGGNGNTCATSAVVRVSTPFRSGLDDKTSTTFNQLLSDFRVAVSQLFESYSLDPFANLDVDASAIEVQSIDGNTIQLDMPFSIFPDPARGITAPSLLRTKAILQAAAEQRASYKNLILIALLDVGRAGVCGNGFCEYGELELRYSPSTCGIDCPGVYSCPVGDTNSLVGDRSLQCVGRGTCVQATGACKCDEGYTGPNCGACAAGFSAANGACYPESELRPVSPKEADEPTSSSAMDSQTMRDAIIGALFGLLGLVLIGVAVYWMVALRRRKAEARDSGLAYRVQEPVSRAPTPTLPPPPSGVLSAHHEPEVPTRQVTETQV
eukprot:jgi/Tetstr1/461975/TSEL_007048.t1